MNDITEGSHAVSPGAKRASAPKWCTLAEGEASSDMLTTLESKEATKMNATLKLVAAIAPLTLMVPAPSAPNPPMSGNCSSKVLHYSSAGPPIVDRWVLDCTGDACCDKHDGSSAETPHYKFCSCDQNENKCCHIVVVTNGGPPPSGIGKAVHGDCSTQSSECPTGTTCKWVVASVEPPWQEAWTSACE